MFSHSKKITINNQHLQLIIKLYYPTLLLQSSIPGTMPATTKSAYIGFGPRAQIEVAVNALFVILYKQKIEAFVAKNGNVFQEISIFEKQDRATGGGNAFQDDSHGMINGGLGLPLDIPGVEKLSPELLELATDIVDLPKRVAEATEANFADIEAEYARISAAAPIMLENAFGSDGHLDTNVECATRGFVGRVARDCFDRVMKHVKEHLGDYIRITIHEGTEVVDVDIAEPTRPVLHLRKENNETRETFDLVTLASGTILRAPIEHERAYGDIPNFDRIKGFFEKFDLLADNHIKPGTSIGFMGLSLSMLDMLMIAVHFTGLVVRDASAPRGYRIDEVEAKKYQGLACLFNREPGAFSGLRTKYNQTWEGVEPLLTPEETHAAWMHDQGKTLLELYQIGLADVAASCGKMPADITAPCSTEDRATDYNAQIDVHLATQQAGKANLTPSGVHRCMIQSLLNGQGLSSTPGADESELEEKYPLSRSGTSGWPIQRALLFSDTREGRAVYDGNSDLMRSWGAMQNILASGPWVCLGITSDLMKAGVIKYQKASYTDVRANDEGFQLGQTRFDVVFAPKMIDGRDEPLTKNLHKNVVSTYSLPTFAKNRFYKAKNGTLTHVRNIGLAGHGGAVMDVNGKRAMLNVYWGDTNARLSALHRAPAGACVAISCALLRATGDITPLDTIMSRYSEMRPSGEAFNAEVKTLKQHFDTAQDKKALLTLAIAMSKNTPHEFKGHHQRLTTEEGRKAFKEELHDIARDRPDLRPLIEADQAQKVQFAPLSFEQHDMRFVDFLQKDALAIMQSILV